jgi:hypothetical protein
MTVASASFAVALPRTTSSSFITLAGLKKCMPRTSCGRFVACAMRSTSSVEVLVARIAPGFATASSLPNTSCFTAISSNTASITRSALRSSSYESVGLRSAIRLAILSAVSFPFFTVLS